jgi:hypothetical protein
LIFNSTREPINKINTDGARTNQFQFRFNWESLAAVIEKGYQIAQNENHYVSLGQLAIESTRQCFQRDALSELFERIENVLSDKNHNSGRAES